MPDYKVYNPQCADSPTPETSIKDLAEKPEVAKRFDPSIYIPATGAGRLGPGYPEPDMFVQEEDGMFHYETPDHAERWYSIDLQKMSEQAGGGWMYKVVSEPAFYGCGMAGSFDEAYTSAYEHLDLDIGFSGVATKDGRRLSMGDYMRKHPTLNPPEKGLGGACVQPQAVQEPHIEPPAQLR